MIDSQPSKTAEQAATRRAVHQLIDRPIVFEDPLALTILGKLRAASLHSDTRRYNIGTLARRFRAFLAARNRLAEDTLAEVMDTGVCQYVVLGAGLDTFAYRNPYPDLRVFEVGSSCDSELEAATP